MTHCATLLQNLRQRGFRITPQREMIIEALAHSGGHITAEKIHEQVQARCRSVNIATIYRTLDMLVEIGLASRIQLADGQQVFTTRQHGPHIHLVCRVCGGVQEMDCTELLPLVEAVKYKYAFEVDWRHVSIIGICSSCQPKSPN